MAFNNNGALTALNPGQSAIWHYDFNRDLGAQFACADIKSPNPGAVHRADGQKKQRHNDGSTTYFVTITNEGPGFCFHNLSGGGLS